MEFREIIVWIGLLAILVILWDGFRRMRPKIKVKVKKEPEDDWVDPEELAKKAEIARELPNGGARIRQMTEEEKKKLKTKFNMNLNLRERVPMLMERVVVEGEESDADRLENSATNTDDSESTDIMQSEMDFNLADTQTIKVETVKANSKAAKEHIEPTFGSLGDETETDDVFVSDDADDINNSDLDDIVADKASDSVVSVESGDKVESEDDEIDEFQSHSIENEDVQNLDADDHEYMDPDQAINEPKQQQGKDEAPLPVEDLIVVHLMAKNDGEINGRALLELLIRAGLRHGPMDIFHYRNDQGKTEFSLANCVRPGTFNPDTMADVNTPGVTLFLQLPCTADAMEAFEHMIEMARFMAANLEADILDEEHSSVTPQVVEYYREKLRAFARKQLIPS